MHTDCAITLVTERLDFTDSIVEDH
ncbi:MAG: hypothetical protein QOJ42_1446, partial [Acidobacteriaceae bacterium]|nr:hypothetical protein [Acidobacteriaceae bacterium]